MTLVSGKSSARSFHMRMEELPTNTTALFAGGFLRSAPLDFFILASHRVGGTGGCLAATTRAQIIRQQKPVNKVRSFIISFPPWRPLWYVQLAPLTQFPNPNGPACAGVCNSNSFGGSAPNKFFTK